MGLLGYGLEEGGPQPGPKDLPEEGFACLSHSQDVLFLVPDSCSRGRAAGNE